MDLDVTSGSNNIEYPLLNLTNMDLDFIKNVKLKFNIILS